MASCDKYLVPTRLTTYFSFLWLSGVQAAYEALHSLSVLAVTTVLFSCRFSHKKLFEICDYFIIIIWIWNMLSLVRACDLYAHTVRISWLATTLTSHRTYCKYGIPNWLCPVTITITFIQTRWPQPKYKLTVTLKPWMWHYDRRHLGARSNFGREPRAGEDRHCFASILIGSDCKPEDTSW